MTTSTPPDPSGDTPMTRRYVVALVLEVVIIAALYLLGRIYS